MLKCKKSARQPRHIQTTFNHCAVGWVPFVHFSLWSHRLDTLSCNCLNGLTKSQQTDILCGWLLVHVTAKLWCDWLYKFNSDGKRLQKFTDHYSGQASITSRDVPIEKIGANTEFKLSFTSPSIEELASSFRTDGHQSKASAPLL